MILLIACDSRAQVFQDVTAVAGLAGVGGDESWRNGTFGAGMCTADFDGDGDLDLFVSGGQRPSTRAHRYFRNDGAMQFTDMTASMSFGVNRGVISCRSADVDNDGDADLYLGNFRAPPQLFVNDGAGNFVEEAAARGLSHVTSAYGASFADYDRDGWLDLFVANRFEPGKLGVTQASILYRNTGGGNFVDVTDAVGAAHADGATFCGVFMDADEDGHLDLYMVNDKGLDFAPSQWLMQRDGQFVHDDAFGLVDPIDSMGFDYVDAFNDGGLDYFVSDTQPDHLFRVRDPAAQFGFADETHQFGLQGFASGWATHFADFDNDGWFDLHVVHETESNHVYRNPGQPHDAYVPWTEVQYAPYAYPQITAIVADFDDDGRVDILNRTFGGIPGWFDGGLELFRNVSPERNWIVVRTIGSASNRDGIGARVVVRSDVGVQRQCVRGDVGFLSGGDRRVHFGLGDTTTVDEIEVTWPSGLIQVERGVAANQEIVVVEPSMRLVGDPAVGSACIIEIDSPNDAGMHYAIMLASGEFPHTPLPDGRSLPIRVGPLTSLSLTPGNALLHGNVAALHRGKGGGLLSLPNHEALQGMMLFATGVTYDALGIGTVFPSALPIVIQ